ncbi:MAG: hypothetical protein ACFCUT_11135 [Kiloniellaceae bacterium]
MKAISEGPTTLDDLGHIFKVHRRIIIEAIVTLMYAGWIGLDSEVKSGTNRYVLSRAGQVLLKQGRVGKEILPPGISVRAQNVSIVLERVQGQVARNTEVNWFPRAKLRQLWDKGIPLRKRYIRNAVTPSLIDAILPRQPSEWVRSIGIPFASRQGDDYAVVSVDLDGEIIVGLPKAWEPMLREILLNAARDVLDEESDAYVPPDPSELREFIGSEQASGRDSILPYQRWCVGAEAIDVIVGKKGHDEELKRFIGNVRSHLVIVTPDILVGQLRSLTSAIESLIKRGVTISILWGGRHDGSSSEHPKETRELLKKLEYDANAVGVRGQFNFSHSASGSGACILFGDCHGIPSAVIGSHSWLGREAEDYSSARISVRIAHPGIIRGVALSLTDLMLSDRNTMDSSEPIRLQNLAARLAQAMEQDDDEQTDELDVGCLMDQPHSDSDKALTVSLVLGSLNHAVLREGILRASSSVLLSVDQCEGALLKKHSRAIENALKGGQRSVRIEIGSIKDDDPRQTELAIGHLQEVGADIVVGSTKCSGCLFIDSDFAVISSRQWLIAQPAQQQAPVSDIGLIVEGPGVVARFQSAALENAT